MTSTVAQLAAQWAATADSVELAQVEALCRTYVRAHGTGQLTTLECRSVYSLFVQEGNEKGNGKSYAYAMAVAAAVESAPYGSLRNWDYKKAAIASKAQARKDKAAATREARKLATVEGQVAPSRATAHAACSHEATPKGRKACRTARKAAQAA